LWFIHSKSNNSMMASRTRMSAKIGRRVLKISPDMPLGMPVGNASLTIRPSRTAGTS
jgi:hypothetical protein